MKKLTGSEIRNMWLTFFKEKGHSVYQSVSLVPSNDKTLLWMNAGVAALKKYFDGSIIPENPRICNAQKCIRTNDIENVGVTARHHTFFEMLGNFSIGDYFRTEAITWAYELLTSPKWFDFDVNRLYFTVYPDDEETYNLWLKLGVPESHLIRTFNNFWEIGEGPSGPDTEIFFDRGDKFGNATPDYIKDDIENDRFIEIWNIVFSQFNADPKVDRSMYKELPHKNIDTGMGLERMASVLQETETNFETDLFMPIINEIEKISGIKYHGQKAFKVIADHLRTLTFAISDGALLSNEGRGYVLRRLLRRAVKHGKALNISRPFLADLVDTVVNVMHDYYPYLDERKAIVKKVVSQEEIKFLETLAQGEKKFLSIIENTKDNKISGEDAFTLYDTYGFPIELTIEYASEKNATVDVEGFNKEMALQKKRARDARLDISSMSKQNEEYMNYKESSVFVGYEDSFAVGKLIKIFDGGLVFDKTPFYAESGGQVADTGKIFSDFFKADVKNVIKLPNGQHLHEIENVEGDLILNELYNLKINVEERELTRYNHSATHIMFKVLRDELGSHVSQQGSQVTSKALRFDFNHFELLTKEEILRIEKKVNEIISKGYKGKTSVMSVNEAVDLGAVAEFGEKYSSLVRVVDLGVTKDLCGGTHVDDVSKIGRFAIVSVESKGSGIYRITGVTNKNVDNILEYGKNTIKDIDTMIEKGEMVKEKALLEGINLVFNHEENPQVLGSYQDLLNLQEKYQLLKEEIKTLEKEYNRLKEEKSLAGFKEYLPLIKNKTCVALVDIDGNMLKPLAEYLHDKSNKGIIFLCSTKGDRITFVCKTDGNTDALALVKAAAQVAGGNGGGKRDLAQAGGKDLTKVNEALDVVRKMLCA